MSNNLKCIHERIGVIKYESMLNLSYYNKFQVNNKYLWNLDERNSIVHSVIMFMFFYYNLYVDLYLMKSMIKLTQ
jgi:hypothetical protein